MKLLDKIAGTLGFQRKPVQPMRRSYAGAQASRLTEDWAASLASADVEIRGGGQKLRARARDLERNNPFVKRYLKLLENNVLGANGIGLQMKVRDPDKFDAGKIVKGALDTLANQTIEAGWSDWSRGANCSVDGVSSWFQLQRLTLVSTARDGAAFIVFHEGQGKHGLQLQILEADFLREDYNDVLANGNIVRMGVEMTVDRKPVAYHFWNRHPYDYGMVAQNGLRFVRVEASRVIHVCRRDRQGQTNGASWLAPVMIRLQMLNGYEEAEITAARTAACKGGFYTHATPEGYQGPTDNLGNPTQEMQPGQFEDLPMGTNFVPLDPQHPVTAYGDFVKACLRGISSGLGVSYNSLASDLEGVNYSSIRAGLLEEREEWKNIQTWFIETVVEPIFEAWLRMALLSGSLKMPNGSALPAAKLDKFNSPEWKPRRWPWVDPLKDMQASVLSVEKGFSSARHIIAEGGGDIEDVYSDQAADKQLAEQYGLDFPKDIQPTAPRGGSITGQPTE